MASGFQLATAAGPLCDESMWGVAFEVSLAGGGRCGWASAIPDCGFPSSLLAPAVDFGLSQAAEMTHADRHPAACRHNLVHCWPAAASCTHSVTTLTFTASSCVAKETAASASPCLCIVWERVRHLPCNDTAGGGAPEPGRPRWRRRRRGLRPAGGRVRPLQRPGAAVLACCQLACRGSQVLVCLAYRKLQLDFQACPHFQRVTCMWSPSS